MLQKINWEFENKSTQCDFSRFVLFFFHEQFLRLEKFLISLIDKLIRICRVFFKVWHFGYDEEIVNHKKKHTLTRNYDENDFFVLYYSCALFSTFITFFFWKNATSYYGFSLNILVKDLWFWKILWCKRPLRSWSHCFHR